MTAAFLEHVNVTVSDPQAMADLLEYLNSVTE